MRSRQEGDVAKVSMSETIPASPERVWEVAADLSRLGEWLTLHEAWRGTVPEQLAVGTTLTSVVSVKGMRNRIAWQIDDLNEPRALTLSGNGVGGVATSLELVLRSEGERTQVDITVALSGRPLFGPIGAAVGKALNGDIRDSLTRLSALVS